MSRTTSKRPDAAPVKTSESESALRRWSRRKHEARVTARRESATSDPVKAPNVAASEKSPERVLTDVDMPPLETLGEHSDYSPFMSAGVSEGLRRAALRRLFSSPGLNVLCELEGEYYDTRGLTPLGNIVTYDMRAALERELEQAKSSAKEKVRDELTDAKVSEVTEGSEVPMEPTDQPETDTEVVAAHRDEKPLNDRGTK